MAGEKQDNAPQSDGAANAPPLDQDFDAAMAELDTGDDAPASAAADIPSDVPLHDAADTPAPASAAAPDAPAAADNAPAGEPQDIWKDADPRLKEAYEASMRDAQYRVDALKGRQSAQDRELQELRRLRQAGQGGQQQEQPQRQEQPASTAGKSPTGLTARQLEALREDYPDLAAPLLDVIEQQNAKLQHLERGVSGYTQERALQAEQAQQAILEQSHPDWSTAVTDDRFEGWLGSQSTAIREAFARNADGWVDGRDAALVVGQFKADVGLGRQASPAPAPAGNQGQGDRRQRQLANGRDAGAGGPSVSSSGPDDQDFDGWVDVLGAKATNRQTSRV